MLTPASFKIMFPEFNAEENDRIQLFIDNAGPFFDVCRWADWYDEGLANYVAHKLTMANRRAALGSGPGMGGGDTAIGKKVGDLSIQRSDAALLMNMKDSFQATSYGQEYRRLARMVGLGMRAV